MTSLSPNHAQNDRRRLRIARRPPDSIRPASPRPQRRDCQGQLLAAITAMAGAEAMIEFAGISPWCSATFVGARHHMRLVLTGADAARQMESLRKTLGEAAFDLLGHVVIDAVVDAAWVEADGSARLDLALLTIEDW